MSRGALVRRLPLMGGPLVCLGLLACGRPKLADLESGEDESSEGESSEGESSEGESSEGESSEGESTATATDEGDDMFVPTFDMRTPIPVPCDPFAQECPEGEKCAPFGSGGNLSGYKCVPVLGDVPAFEPCHLDGFEVGTDDCDETGACWPVWESEGQLVGLCSPFCQGTSDDPICPPDSSCDIHAIGSSYLCLETCDPLVQDCFMGLGCYWDGTNGDFHCVFSPSNLPAGAPCGFINDCAPGLACLPPDVFPDCQGAACCSPFCNVELGDEPCDAAIPGTSCVHFFELGMAPPGYELVGVCIVP